MLLTQTSYKYLTQISSNSSELGVEHANKVRKDLIGITQSDSARDPSLTWKLMTHKTLKVKSQSALTEQFVLFTLSVNKYHDLVVLNITSLTEVYAMLTIKHKDEKH